MMHEPSKIRRIYSSEQTIKSYFSTPKEERYAFVINSFFPESFVPTGPQKVLIEALSRFETWKGNTNERVFEVANRFLKTGGTYEEAYDLLTETIWNAVAAGRGMQSKSFTMATQESADARHDFVQVSTVLVGIADTLMDTIDSIAARTSEIPLSRKVVKLEAMSKVDKPELTVIVLDTSYFNSIVTRGDDVGNILRALHDQLSKSGAEPEIVITGGIYNELLGQLKGPRGQPERDDKGRPKFTSLALNELHKLIYKERILKLEMGYIAGEKDIGELSRMMQRKSNDRNARVGSGDASVVMYLADMAEAGKINFTIMSRDTDFIKMLSGCKNVTVTA